MSEIDKKSQGKFEYSAVLNKVMFDYQLSDTEKTQLTKIIKTYDLKPEDLASIHKKTFSEFFEKIMEDGKITDKERVAMRDISLLWAHPRSAWHG